MRSTTRDATVSDSSAAPKMLPTPEIVAASRIYKSVEWMMGSQVAALRASQPSLTQLFTQVKQLRRSARIAPGG
ncbi:hypothetical protein Tamer19_55160 [Cupriavidus sp. TA19]|nr:hypothetical protein Tamer19_55160 [Cupriavidus sp. TA19]